ncbi:MAG: type VII secretion protein EssC [Lachnospiraceae bacterium]|nr:type VII secretion protein EssC [Lachnospiraceae bacterium]
MASTERLYERRNIFTLGAEGADIELADSAIEIIVRKDRLEVYGCSERCSLNGQPIETGRTYDLYKESRLRLDLCCLTFYETALFIQAPEEAYRTKLPEIQERNYEFEGFPDYKRSPRIIKRIPQDTIEIANPPERSQMAKTSLIQTIVPPILMSAVTVLVGVFLKMGAFMMLSALTTVLTTLFSVVKYFNERKACRQKNEKRKMQYQQYLLDKRKELNRLREQEIEAWRYNYPRIEEIERLVKEYSARIYERSIHDDDFLTVSVGYSHAGVSFPIRFDSRDARYDADELEEEGAALKETFGYLEEKPMIVDLKRAHLGLVGDKENVHEQVKLLVTQLAFAQSYHDLQIIVIYNKRYEDEFAWMKWLPHCKIQMLNLRGIINSEHMRDQVLGSLHQILKDRKMKWEEKKNEAYFAPYFLFVIDDPKLISSHAVMEYLDKEGRNMAFSVIYTTQQMENLPDHIGTVVEVLDSEKGRVVLNEKVFVDQMLMLYHTGETNLEWIARNLSVLHHEQGIVSKIPESITFYEMYRIRQAEELQAENRWRKNHSHRSLAVPLGVRGNEEYVYLNLHEKAHGPHGLVAGTTGSGKSELIQSYILSLAVNFHPYEVGFLLIDYKGGGMAGMFQNLPHLLGTITNLDGSESKRAMASIKSELTRRQRIFSRYGVNHINGYNKLFRSGEADSPIPHLFLISDEFAELKKEQPDFMVELISTARIGRSLGVHLILATQKPTGVVDDQIWSNSKFKLALKVQDEGDSREILKTPDAAFITQPGRAYLQVGNNEIYELFQSAWSGAPAEKEGDSQKADNRVYLINELGQGDLLNEDLYTEEEQQGKRQTELEAVVDYLDNVFAKLHCARVPRPWLPPLPQRIANPQQDVRAGSALDLTIPIGVVDIPDQQSQEEYVVNLETEGNIGYFAAGGYGKSMMLTNCILSLARKNSVSMLNFYLFDFGNSALISLKNLAHTADYITYDDEEKRDKFFKLMQAEMKRRKRMLAKQSAQNYTVYNQIAGQPLKAIVVIVDHMDILKEIGVEEEEEFSRMARDGAGLGIYLVFAAQSEHAVRYGTLNNMKIKIAGYMYDASDVASLVGRGEYQLPDCKGRAMVKYNGINVMQLYTAVPYQDEIQYMQQLKAVIEEVNQCYEGQRAPRIPVLPESFQYGQTAEYERDADGMDIVLGLDVETVRLKGMQRIQSPFAIVGDSGRGKTNALKCVLNQLDKGETVYLFDSRNRELNTYKSRENLTYVQPEQDITSFVRQMEVLGLERQEAFSLELADNPELTMREFICAQDPVYVLADGADEFISRMNEAYEETIAEILKRAADMGVTFIITVHAARFHGYDELTTWIKHAGDGLVLGEQGQADIFPVSYQEHIEMTRGLLFANGIATKIMIPEC